MGRPFHYNHILVNFIKRVFPFGYNQNHSIYYSASNELQK
ncbi:hypothetical protein YPPY13_1681 [Yersinia pestis PY-13]|uniref:Uncharacterized protein n=1 Tax=Yersinia pestis PY-08 TaxID=992134 RepID=A0AB72ZLF6_YERPE|nr:hypothetical protein YPPY02_1618 [Yersinia pestis PY-02]EIQ93211.1 hypothetical protein YPPY03_1700 [Yersinia pestis PY-03]EIR05915.1 hypothetical protein YPPY05_1629 [Yersinia pestis PY-05]EIR09151.1 hypothetical protein YPPY06_1663 [Yersinia pestis PY-06]EIR19999.1 hypothetical protein YPPY07_1560 [Yersinia pestis PY-07]EIR20919.1 hypothetical protein YPPY08_1676 [Yersinia pestis PY-08]EIR22802.1 hypothetical protein YPPY09_1683 [Yersinia pestis PY-09]EIR34835.1 hypothetical protein YPP